MIKTAELYVIQCAKGFVMESGVQQGKITPDLAKAKRYDSPLKASNMMKGWSKVGKWKDECWVAKVQLKLAGKCK